MGKFCDFALYDTSCSVDLISQSTHYYWRLFFFFFLNRCAPRRRYDISRQAQHSWRSFLLAYFFFLLFHSVPFYRGDVSIEVGNLLDFFSGGGGDGGYDNCPTWDLPLCRFPRGKVSCDRIALQKGKQKKYIPMAVILNRLCKTRRHHRT